MRQVIDIKGCYTNLPEITGLELTMNQGVWEGRYYLNGQRHSYKRDKLRIKMWNSPGGCQIVLHEQGGDSMTLQKWLVTYGGASDYREAFRIMRGSSMPDSRFISGVIKKEIVTKYIEPSIVDAAYADYDLMRCPLFTYLLTMFSYRDVFETWLRYKVTTDNRGLAVFWYCDPEGRVCYDKRMKYHRYGKRDKSFGGTRIYKTSDGYTARPLFGSHLIGNNYPLKAEHRQDADFLNIREGHLNLVESEKTALLCSLYFGGLWLATGGKNGLKREVVSERSGNGSELTVFPDLDAVDEWRDKTDCEVNEWWLLAESKGIKLHEKSDIGDLVIELIHAEIEGAASNASEVAGGNVNEVSECGIDYIGGVDYPNRISGLTTAYGKKSANGKLPTANGKRQTANGKQ